MARRREKIIVLRDCGRYEWMLPGNYAPSYGSKAAALRSARAYARKFIEPPDVIVEDNE